MTAVQELVDQATNDEESPFKSIDVEMVEGGIHISEATYPNHDFTFVDKKDFPKLIAVLWGMVETDLQNKERENLALWEGAS